MVKRSVQRLQFLLGVGIPGFCAALLAASAAAASLLVIAAWVSGYFGPVSAPPPYPPTSAHAALWILLIAAAIMLRNSGAAAASLALGIGTLLGLCLEALVNLDLLPGSFTRLWSLGLPGYGFTDKLISVNTIASMFFLVCGVLLVSRPRPTRQSSTLAFIAVLFGISISGFALFGYFAHTEAAYWWQSELQCPPGTAVMLLLLGFALLGLSWQSIGVFNARISELVQVLQSMAGAVLIATVALSAGFSVVPLYEALFRSIYDDLKTGVELESVELSRYLSRFIAAAEALQADGRSDFAGLERVRSLLPGVTGLALFEQGRNIPFASTGPLPFQAPASTIARPELSIASNGGRTALFCDTPFSTPSHGPVILRASLDPEHLLQALSFRLPPFTNGGRAYLLQMEGDVPRAGLEFIIGEGSARFLGNQEASGLTALVGQTPHVPVLHKLADANSFAVFEPVSSFPAEIGVVIPLSRASAVSHNPLGRVLFGLGALLLVSTALIFLVMRRLARQIISLDSELRNSIALADAELALRKTAQAEAEQSLAAKEVLLREVHHRVKNNLQVISSLLSLQLRRTLASEARTALNSSANRIQSIALLHDTLYRSQDLTAISLHNYFTELWQHVRSLNNNDNIELRIIGADQATEIDRAIPLGLIMTELFMNSMAYAFPASRNGSSPDPEVIVRLSQAEDGMLVIDYSDNGIGLPEEYCFEASKTLGSRLVDTLVRQLRGRITVLSSGGAQFRIVIPFITHHVRTEKTRDEQTANFHS